MAGANIVELTDQNFEEVCLKSEVPVMVDFWAPWCGPCRAMAPAIDALAKEVDGKLKVAKHNTQDFPDTAVKYGVTAIPTLVFFKNGAEVHREIGGGKTVNDLKKIIQKHLGNL
ncbi:MAG: thioredoxin [Planctomycetota bacterium]